MCYINWEQKFSDLLGKANSTVNQNPDLGEAFKKRLKYLIQVTYKKDFVWKENK